MASSSSQQGQRRKQSEKRRQIIRSNSSLLGTIKNIVANPLAWFASTDDFEDSKDPKGKRRRLVAAPTEPSIEDDDRGTRTKRMRVHSPPRDEQQDHQQPQQPQLSLSHGYLDPPSSAFNQQHRLPHVTNGLAETSAPMITRSASVTLPSPTIQDFPYNARKNSRSTLSPMRNLSISRTMSIDPPARPLSREPSFQAPLHRDISMGPSGSFSYHPYAVQRDLSLPPVPFSARPSFRMRTSITPQPPHRELSEPPAFTTLRTNPTFVRGPPSQPLDSQPISSSHPAATLGSLVDSARSQTQSPVRQHSSIFFGSSSTLGADNSPAPHQQTAAEKALHELEVYRTPLLPTRLRSSNFTSSSSITATSGVPDMFKTRRASSLILMQDDKRSERLGRKVSDGKPMVNDTKPYAGEGGMKRLLARRKLEVEDIEEQQVDGSGDGEKREKVGQNEDDAMDGDIQPTEKLQAVAPPSVPIASKSDWYSAASATSSASGSSLRVGRAKSSRNHIARPAMRPLKNKFSATYEDEGEDGMEDGETDESTNERKVLEEAAKKAPLFHIPSGFSFANKAKPVEHDLSKAKEPPIPSLPFSFVKPVSSSSTPHASALPDALALKISSGPSTTMGNEAMTPVPLFGLQDRLISESKASASEPSSTTGIPNFFATSSVLSKPFDLTSPAALALNATDTSAKPSVTPISTPNPSFSSTSLTAGAPVKDTANPFWDGEQKEGAENLGSKQQKDVFKALDRNAPVGAMANGKALSASSFLGQSSGTSASIFSTVSASVDPTSVFHGTQESKSTMLMPASTAPPRFSFNKSDGLLPSSGTTFDFGDNSARLANAGGTSKDAGTKSSSVPPAEPEAFLGNNGSANPATIFGAEAPKSSTLFGGDASESNPNTLSDLAQPTSSSALFSFAQQSGSNAAPFSDMPQSTFTGANRKATEPSKPSFDTNSFSFGKTGSADSKEKGNDAQPFSFGLLSDTAPVAVDAKQSPIFAFGASGNTPSASSPIPVTFSFSEGGSVTADVSSKPFTFGSSAPAAPIERPVTPPRNQEQEFRMEESPTRDMQQMNGSNKVAEPRPSLGFTFQSSTPFGGSTGSLSTASNPFSFGSSTSTASHPFSAKESKAEDSKPFGGFAQANTAPSSAGVFMFSPSKATGSADVPRPSSAGSFSFSTTPTSTAPNSFSFGAPPIAGASNPFGQPQPSSAPSSPSTFGQPSSFSFGPPTQTTGPSFAFGSQPASPASGNASLILPQPTTPGGFSSTATGSGFGQAPSSPFAAPTSLASVPSSGGTLFTIGAAPAPAPASGQRQIRKLPTRRGGKR